MGAPLRGLAAGQLERFRLGQQQFERVFAPADGLGPIFTDTSCAACHVDPQAFNFGEETVLRFGRGARDGAPFDPLAGRGGTVFQNASIDRALILEVLPPEADVKVRRITPHVFGAGLVDAVPDAAFLALEATPPSADVSGSAHRVEPIERGQDGAPARRVGRFGWKAQLPTLFSFTAEAGRDELGITNTLFPEESAPNGDRTLLARADRVPDPEDGSAPAPAEDEPGAVPPSLVDRWTDFQRFLAPPPQMPPQGTMRGEAVFGAIGCADCHVATLVTAADAEPPLAGRALHPYGDFLLHDVGTLGDGIVQGDAAETEMRTAPLWGLVFKTRMLHDGRVMGGPFPALVARAIEHHDGEGAPSRDRFAALPEEDREALFRFLRSLGRTAFDFDVDNDVDVGDWLVSRGHLTGPAGPYFDVEAPAAVGDTDLDGDLDLADVGRFARGFTGKRLASGLVPVDERPAAATPPAVPGDPHDEGSR